MERLFYGRLKLEAAAAHFYFTKRSLVQTLIHELKYRGNRHLGIFLGELMGHALLKAGRFQDIDLLVALPLHRSRQRKRGYNQAAVLIEGIATAMNLPFLEHVLERRRATRTQTRKGRVDRWLNMQGVFHVRDPAALEGKHVLLVDDVITTGATLEACGRALLEVPGLRLSISCLCQAEN